MVGDSDWTVEEIIAEDRIRHIEVRAVNEESGEVYVHKSETVTNRAQRVDFIFDFRLNYEELCRENPELLNARIVFIACVQY